MLSLRALPIVLLPAIVVPGNAWSLQLGSIPKPKVVLAHSSTLAVGRDSVVYADDSVRVLFGVVFKSLEETINTLPPTGEKIDIRCSVATQAGERRKYEADVRKALSHREAYWISVEEDTIRVTGADPKGLLHGLTTLEYLLIAKQGAVSQGSFLDWPDHGIRALHLPLQATKPEEIRNLITLSRFGHFNTLILELSNSVRLKTLVQLNLAAPAAWEIADLQNILHYARENGLEVIPELALLTHQEKLLSDRYPDVMFNSKTYDPRKERVYGIVFPLLGEVINLVHPRAVHIGHDEVAGFSPKNRAQWLRNNEEVLPPELFVRHIKRLHAYLSRRNIQTWMWGDMLIAPDEFPLMDIEHAFHGMNGYAAVRRQIPSDITVCDWHYFDDQREFPTARQFAKEGHSVLGATWEKPATIRNFSRYLVDVSPNGRGMIATTWYHVQRKKWDAVYAIINLSGEAFWNAR